MDLNIIPSWQFRNNALNFASADDATTKRKIELMVVKQHIKVFLGHGGLLFSVWDTGDQTCRILHPKVDIWLPCSDSITSGYASFLLFPNYILRLKNNDHNQGVVVVGVAIVG